jgi:hypothetical protein
MKGQIGIEKGLASILTTRAKSATQQTKDVTIRFIRPDVALANVTNELSGLAPEAVIPKRSAFDPERKLGAFPDGRLPLVKLPEVRAETQAAPR